MYKYVYYIYMYTYDYIKVYMCVCLTRCIHMHSILYLCSSITLNSCGALNCARDAFTGGLESSFGWR